MGGDWVSSVSKLEVSGSGLTASSVSMGAAPAAPPSGGEAGDVSVGLVSAPLSGAGFLKAGMTVPPMTKSCGSSCSAEARRVPARNHSGTAQTFGYSNFLSRRKL
eukprot:6456008-Amphidinium_carterae.2